MQTPATLQEAIQYFANYDNCRSFMVELRWPNGVIKCPYCGSEKIAYLAKARVYRCYGDHPKQKFSLKVGTIFEDSPIPLEKWLPAVWLLVNCKNGISSYEIHRALGVTQKSGWFMLQRIRLAVQTKSFLKLGGDGKPVEVDESFIGGAARFMHAGRRKRMITARGVKDKAAAFGLLERGGEVRVFAVPSRRRKALQGHINEHVAAGSAIYSDAFMSYVGLKQQGFAHQVIDHAAQYVDGQVHTNGMENFWSLLKRSLKGTYISVEPFHLFRYLDEQAWRYNHRATKEVKVTDGDRFRTALSQIVGKRLTFAEVTGKVGERAA
ncbi:MAG TPA: IS1595 family transposase [Candidatus Acidoferrum sp.]